jgi:hypothetical protein
MVTEVVTKDPQLEGNATSASNAPETAIDPAKKAKKVNFLLQQPCLETFSAQGQHLLL